MQRYGIGASALRRVTATAGNAPPVYPGNGSGGPGILGGQTVNVGSAQRELSDLTTGRITLGLVQLSIIGLVGFYLWTRSSQGG